jgi:hypothetical protein
MYAFLFQSHCQSRILIHENYGNHKESTVLAELFGRSEKGEAFKSRTMIFLSLKLTPDNAHVFCPTIIFCFFLPLRFDCLPRHPRGRRVSSTGSGPERSALTPMLTLSVLVLLRIPDFRDRDFRIFKPILKKGFESDADL